MLTPTTVWHYTAAQPTGESREAIVSFENEYWLPLHRLEQALYHYTTRAGLEGILRNRSLRFGYVLNMNDPGELSYCQNLVTDTIESYRRNTDSSPKIEWFLKDLLTNVKWFSSTYDIFAACFCESDNLLSQWRAYADRGAGYCIEFDFNDSTQLMHSPVPETKARKLHIRKVIYKQEQQIHLIKRFLDLMMESVDQFVSNSGHRSIEDWRNVQIPGMAMEASNALLEFMYTFKHPAFEEEAEWRLILTTRKDHLLDQVRFDDSSQALKPYKEIYLRESVADRNNFPARSIRLGPFLDETRTRPVIDLLVRTVAATSHPISLHPSIEIRGADCRLRPF